MDDRFEDWLTQPTGEYGGRTQEFLNLYKTLEDLLTARYEQRDRKYQSIVVTFLNDAAGRPYKEQLNLCREIRNLLSHTADIGGEPVVEPSAPLVEMLRNICDYVRELPLALSFATPREKLLQATLDQNMFSLIRVMDKRGFSHVPIFERDRLYGVFSIGSLFSYAMNRRDVKWDKSTTLREFKSILPVENHRTERFRFVDRQATYWDVREEFEVPGGSNAKRLVAVFITENGGPKDPVLGMITPWDVLGKSKFK